jgi:hypothetical protein
MKAVVALVLLLASAPAHGQYVRVSCDRINGWLTCDCTSPGGPVFEAECERAAMGELDRRLREDCAAGDQDACRRTGVGNSGEEYRKAAERWRRGTAEGK